MSFGGEKQERLSQRHKDTEKNQKTLCLRVSVRKFFVDSLQMAE